MTEEKEEFLDGFPNLDSFNQEALRAIALATKASNGIPSDRKEDWDFYTTFKSFRQVANAQGESLRKSIVSILNHNGIKCPVPKNGDHVSNATGDILEMLADANDQLLERIGMHLDEAAGLKKDIDPVLIEVKSTVVQDRPISGSWNRSLASGKSTSNPVKLWTAMNITRPQLAFKDMIDNSAKTPFIPRLQEKPHSLKPLSILIEYSDQNEEVYSHPYVFEIDNFKMPPRQLENCSGVNTRPHQESQVEFVDTKKKLLDMIQQLKKYPEIGVDLEAHTYRTFQGITCLIQISSIDKDYIIDPFPLWQDLTCLNEVFADPQILKIFHGGRSDIQWLQRDFSVYVVNMFDSYIASQVLDFPRGCRSLAFMLHTFSKVTTDKKFQLADWRIRPIPEEMINYARVDTHYLMEIFHALKKTLIEKSNENLNLLQSVYDQSNELCKVRFHKPHFHADFSYADSLRKSNVNHFNNRQVFAYREIFNWRNGLARTEDESDSYILPAHMLLKICTELPREMQGILACCNPIPPMVKQNLQFLHEIVLKARDQPLIKVNDAKTVDHPNEENFHPIAILEDPLKCPLDMSHWGQEEDLEVILGKDVAIDCEPIVKAKLKAQVEAFSFEGNTSATKLQKSFLSPFLRYKMLKPYLKAINDEKSSEKEVSDQDRINSIKEHFDALTALSAQDMASESVKNDEDNDSLREEEEIKAESNDFDVDSYEPDPGAVKGLRDGLGKTSRKRNGKRFMEGHDKKPKVDYQNVDFAQFSSGKGANKKIYDPNAEFQSKFKGKKKAGKAKQHYKRSGKSVTYKK